MNRKPTQLWNAPRCGVYCPTTGKPCRNPAVRGKKLCRVHEAAEAAPRPRDVVRDLNRQIDAKLDRVLREAGLKPRKGRPVDVEEVVAFLFKKAEATLKEQLDADAAETKAKTQPADSPPPPLHDQSAADKG
jgi:hypothetical protein